MGDESRHRDSPTDRLDHELPRREDGTSLIKKGVLGVVRKEVAPPTEDSDPGRVSGQGGTTFYYVAFEVENKRGTYRLPLKNLRKVENPFQGFSNPSGCIRGFVDPFAGLGDIVPQQITPLSAAVLRSLR